MVKNQVFIPTIAESFEDVSISLKIQQELVRNDYLVGLMLVIKNGRKGITLDSILQKQYSNLKKISDYKGAIVVMLSNIPIEEMDFIHNSEYATEHVKRGVDFASGLPIGERKIVTFHLNSLVTPAEFEEKTAECWRKFFDENILPCLQVIAKYGRSKGIEIKVETVPVPEFGDISFDDKRMYRGVLWNQLRNPFYLSCNWGFEQIHASGLGICLDLCHNRTIYEVARLRDPDGVLHKADIEKLSVQSVFDDVKALQIKDILHVNDGVGVYSEKNKTVHREGVVFGRGDIANMKNILKYLNERQISYALEINETDFLMRPDTKASIDFILNIGD